MTAVIITASRLDLHGRDVPRIHRLLPVRLEGEWADPAPACVGGAAGASRRVIRRRADPPGPD